jgi:hypothetical protein
MKLRATISASEVGRTLLVDQLAAEIIMNCINAFIAPIYTSMILGLSTHLDISLYHGRS